MGVSDRAFGGYALAMASHEPQDTAGQLDAEGIPEEELPPGVEGTGGDYEEEPIPRDYPIAALDFGTTAVEQAAGESLERRVAREHRDVWADLEEPDDADLDLSRSADEDERVDVEDDLAYLGDDDEDDALADFQGDRLLAVPNADGELLGSRAEDHSALSAEELAMHLEPGQ
jgi:hypothetical protein